jgi:hypothetical protein
MNLSALSALAFLVPGALSVCVFITAGPNTKLFAWGGTLSTQHNVLLMCC